MNHLSEDELVLLYYGDDADPGVQKFQNHVAACSECRKQLERLTEFLGAIHVPVPEPPENYERDVWRKLAPMLPDKPGTRPIGRFSRFNWAAAVAMAAMFLAAFSLGRWFERSVEVAPARVAVSKASDDALQKARERALLLAVGSHFERVQIMLAELANTASAPMIDISSEQEAARTLLPDNRLYRETANQLADVQIAMLLDELERLLLDLSHSPSVIEMSDFDEIRDHIESQGILFKVRIAGSELRSRQTNTGL